MSSAAAINNLGGCALNPRGNLWFNDESTFGHKLLMKMGWSKGKGLGKNEDGIKENVKVRYRATNTGLGFKDDAHNNVMKSEYESILKQLHDEHSFKEAPTDKSQKSRIVKSRVRYPKLYFGKDVTKYSEKDMKSIFICSQPVASSENKVEDSIISPKKEPERNFSKSCDTYSSELSISDYFAKKMKEKKEKKDNILSGNSDHSPNQTFVESESHLENLSGNTKTPKRKRKISEMDVHNDSMNSSIVQSVTCNFDGNTENLAALNGKKASKKRKKNSELDINEVRTDVLHINEGENEDRNFSKKKQRLSEDSGCENIILDNKIYKTEKTLNKSYKSIGKKQKSQTCENGFNSKDVTEMLPETTASYEAESSSVFSKKKKKKKVKDKKLTAVKLPLENCVSENDENLTESYKVRNDDSVSESIEDKLANNGNCTQKKKKLKQKLKSCLKTKRDFYSMKNVSSFV